MSSTAELDQIAGKRARTKAANRRAILDAARRVFARIGYEATNIRDIVRETHLASGTFYNYFKSKEEVFEALSADSIARFRPLLQSVKEQAADLETYVRSAYRAYFTFLASENDHAISEGAPHVALIGVRVDTPEMATISEEIRTDLEDALARAGYAHIDTDYLTAAAIGVALEVGDNMLRRRPVDPEQATHFAAQIVLAGIDALGEPNVT
ncbi:MAG: TetR/AcrR family transcriptional regulator [Pseudomonadota bacterium]